MGNDNTVRFESKVLQIPESSWRHHFVRARVRVHRYPDESLAIFYGPRRIAAFGAKARPVEHTSQQAA